jgi:WS/DGAT/MGAT family acyltransferase
MAAVDRAWLRMDRPDNQMIITGILMFDRAIEWESLLDIVGSRLGEYARFRQRVVQDGDTWWEDDPEFHVSRHLERVRIDEPADRESLQRFVSRRFAEPLDPKLPLWRFYYIENFNHGSALVARAHHCIGDGMSLVQVLLRLADAVDGSDSLAGAVAGAAKKTKSAAAGSGRRVFGVIGTLFGLATMSSDPQTSLRGPLGAEKKVAWSDRISLVDIKRVRRHLGGTINDVLVTAVAGGLRDRLEERSPGSAEPLRAMLPVNLRPPDELKELGNRFGLVFLQLPLDRDDDVARFREVQRRMNRLKRSMQAGVIYGLLRVVGALAPGMQGLAVRILGKNATAVLTNLPGPRERLGLCGAEIEDFMFWVPQSGDLGVGISLVSYNGSLRLGIVTDVGLESDPALLVDATIARLRCMIAEAPQDVSG